ncbi:MAG: ABC transporter substrate-binding protein, partial [Cellulomonadaceae bacterium]|nr:ABC transporter substrate-binding protein [Cellulomonadaceae bacterium]
FAQDLGSRAINQPTATFQGLTIPSDIDHFGDNDEGWLRRRAISHAIDRKAIASTVLADTVTPAHDFTSSMLPGWTDTIAGVEALDHDVAQAKDLWTQADAIDPYTGAFTITYNADGGHGPWIDAICEQITETLGINAHGIPIASYDSFRAQVTDHLVGGAFRMRWQADYPSLYNFLGPLYESYGAGNDGGFTAPEVDQLLAQAMSATNIDDSNAAMIAVQQELLKRLPVIPLWYSNVTGGVSSSVNNVVFGWNSVPLYYSVVKN